MFIIYVFNFNVEFFLENCNVFTMYEHLNNVMGLWFLFCYVSVYKIVFTMYEHLNNVMGLWFLFCYVSVYKIVFTYLEYFTNNKPTTEFKLILFFHYLSIFLCLYFSLFFCLSFKPSTFFFLLSFPLPYLHDIFGSESTL